MFSRQRLTLVVAAIVLAALGQMGFASAGLAAPAAESPSLAYDFSALAPPAPAPAADTPAAPPPVDGAQANGAQVDPASLDCMAKIVHHEARGQPRKGQIAVAQTLVNRLKAGRFGGSICAIANQRGQFFDTARYQPARDSGSWQAAVEVSRVVLTGGGDEPAPGAMFFHAAYHPAGGFFRTRQRVGTIGGQIFYR